MIAPVKKKPETGGRRKALFSDIEDPQERLKLVKRFWRKKLKDQDRERTAIVDVVGEENKRQKRLLLVSRSQQAVKLATSTALEKLVVENDEMPFAFALSRVPRKQRPEVYQAAVRTCIELEKGQDPSKAGKTMRRTLTSLIGLDDIPGHPLSRKTIKAIAETDPDMFAVAVCSLPASSLSLIADEDILDVCSPGQLSTLIGMAAGKIFAGGSGQGVASETRAERKQQKRVSLGRLLDVVVERDAPADAVDDPDFGFAETVVGQLAAEQQKRLAEKKPPTFTVCKLVELADRHRESAAKLIELLDPKIVAAAREMIARFDENRELFDDEFPELDMPDYFSLR